MDNFGRESGLDRDDVAGVLGKDVHLLDVDRDRHLVVRGRRRPGGDLGGEGGIAEGARSSV